MQKQGRMSRFEFVIVFLVLPRLPLRGSWRGAPERARPLMWNRRHSDSLALTKALLIAARCLCITGLALSVCCADTSPKGRGFLLTVKPSFVQPLRHGFAVPPPLVGEALAFRSALPLRQRLPYQGQQRRPPPVAETGRSCWGKRSAADAGCRNPALSNEVRLRGCTEQRLSSTSPPSTPPAPPPSPPAAS